MFHCHIIENHLQNKKILFFLEDLIYLNLIISFIPKVMDSSPIVKLFDILKLEKDKFL
jgi:hypothetical protein